MKIETIELAALSVPDRYHQGVLESAVERIAARFDPRLAGVLTVLETPDGCFYTVDGVQRAEAARRVGLTHVPAVIHYGAYEDGADLFRAANGTEKKMSEPEILYEGTPGVWIGHREGHNIVDGYIIDVGMHPTAGASLFVRGDGADPSYIKLDGLPNDVVRAIRDALTRILAERTDDAYERILAAIQRERGEHAR